MNRRTLVTGAVALGATALLPSLPAQAEEYPVAVGSIPFFYIGGEWVWTPEATVIPADAEVVGLTMFCDIGTRGFRFGEPIRWGDLDLDSYAFSIADRAIVDILLYE